MIRYWRLETGNRRLETRRLGNRILEIGRLETGK